MVAVGGSCSIAGGGSRWLGSGVVARRGGSGCRVVAVAAGGRAIEVSFTCSCRIRGERGKPT